MSEIAICQVLLLVVIKRRGHETSGARGTRGVEEECVSDSGET